MAIHASNWSDNDRRCTNSTASTLNFKLPPEIRKILFKFALKNETPVNVEEGAWRSAPGLLKTCKQIYDETIELYYTLNNFIYHVGGPLRWNGTTWELVQKRSLNFRMMKEIVINLQNIPEWNEEMEYETACRKKVARLAHALLQIPNLQLEVRNCEAFAENFNIVEVLEPLGLLRRVQNIGFRGAFENPFEEEEHAFFHELGALMMGDSPAESCFKMYGNLKAYALSFERHYKRRLFMDSEALSLQDWPDWSDHSRFFDLAAVSKLQRAGAAGAEEDQMIFQFCRRQVLFYLENQYQQVKIEKQILFCPIRLLERDPGTTRVQDLCRHYFLDTDSTTSPVVGFNAFLALVRFSNSFIRIPQMRNDNVPVLPPNDHVYDNMDREVAVMGLFHAVTYESNLSMEQRLARQAAHKTDTLYDWTICCRYFKSALHDMLAQYDEILQTRSQIFKDDIVADHSYGQLESGLQRELGTTSIVRSMVGFRAGDEILTPISANSFTDSSIVTR